jgi:hypothetical protein
VRIIVAFMSVKEDLHGPGFIIWWRRIVMKEGCEGDLCALFSFSIKNEIIIYIFKF